MFAKNMMMLFCSRRQRHRKTCCTIIHQLMMLLLILFALVVPNFSVVVVAANGIPFISSQRSAPSTILEQNQYCHARFSQDDVADVNILNVCKMRGGGDTDSKVSTRRKRDGKKNSMKKKKKKKKSSVGASDRTKNEEVKEVVDTKKKNKKKARTTTIFRDDGFQAAVEHAMNEARILVVVLMAPSSDQLENEMTSTKVANVCERQAHKNGADTKSFTIYMTSSLNKAIKKRIRGGIAKQSSSSSSSIVIVNPSTLQVIVQREYNNSNSSTTNCMGTYLNKLRQHQTAVYAQLQKQRQENLWAHERSVGYTDSVDQINQQRADEKERIRQAKEDAIAAAAHADAMQQRRIELADSIPPEPADDDDDAKIVSIRDTTTTTNRIEKRRLPSDASLSDVFNWMDVTFQIERETVQVSTMNGQQSYTYNDVVTNDNSLSDVFPNKKMIALRYTTIQNTATTATDDSSTN